MGSINNGTMAGKTLDARSDLENNSCDLPRDWSADMRQGVKISFMARAYAGNNIFSREISDKEGAIFEIKTTAWVRMDVSVSACNRTRYRDNFSRFGAFKYGTNPTVALSVNSLKAGLESLNPLQRGSKTCELRTPLSKC
jgi:hypothetical protein